MRKKAQTEMSFGMIFSIILIIVFLTFAFYGIKLFLDFQKTAEAGKFISSLQADVDRVWKSAQSSEQKEYFIPSGASHVCFVDFTVGAKGQNAGFYDDLKRANYGSENLVFYPFGSSDLDSTEMKNINLDSITQSENPYCFKEANGKIQVTFVKELNESLVNLKR